MDTIRFRLLLAAAGLLALGTWVLVPRAIDAAQLLATAGDPVELAELGVDRRFDAAVAQRQMEAALADGDAELAASFLALADERGAPVDPELRLRVAQAGRTAATAVRTAGHFIEGFVVGQPDDLASLAGTVTGDLFVYGDLRDIARETTRLARGEEANELILGLACVGLAITAGTYASLGAASPLRVGVSMVKAAGRTGRMTARLARAMIRPLRTAIDTAALKRMFGRGALLRPAAVLRGARAAVKVERAEGVVRMARDLGRINAKAGTRAALDALTLANSPKDVARLAQLAAAKGGKTRAVLKLLGRGAIALTVGIAELTSWILWALFTVLGFVAALKRMTERATLRFIRWRKRSHAQRLAMAPCPAN